MKNQLTLLLLLLFFNIYAQDTINIQLVDNLRPNLSLENMNITAYQLIDENALISANKNKGVQLLLNSSNNLQNSNDDSNGNYYIFKITNARSHSDDYEVEYFEKFVDANRFFNFPVRPKIKSSRLDIEVIEEGESDVEKKIISNARISVSNLIRQNLINESTDENGILDSMSLPTKNLLRIEVSHDLYETTFEPYYNPGDKLSDKLIIELKKKVFDKTIKVINNKNEDPIDGAIVFFPELESNKRDTTDSKGIASFKNLKSGWQFVNILPLSGYDNKLEEKYFVFISEDGKRNTTKPIRLTPTSRPDSLTITGFVFDNFSNPIQGATVNVKIPGKTLKSISTSDIGEYITTIQLVKFENFCDFEIEISHPDFQTFSSKNEVISLCNSNKSVKKTNPFKLNRIYDYYDITVNKNKAKLKRPIQFVFTGSKNKAGKDELGTGLNFKYEENKTVLTIRGPSQFKSLKMKYNQSAKKGGVTYDFKTNQIQKIESCYWLLKRKKCKCKIPKSN